MGGGDRILRLTPVIPPVEPPEPRDATIARIRALLDAIPGQVAWSLPVRDEAGRIVDFEIMAASREAVDVHGSAGAEMIGIRMSESYPATADTILWESYLRVLETGEPVEIADYAHVESLEGVPHRSTWGVRVSRVSGGLLTAWIRHDEEERQAARLLHTERLGNIGWGHWSRLTGEVEWSDQLYAIHGRDRGEGPIALEHYRTVVHPEDVPVLDRTLDVLRTSEVPQKFEVRIRRGEEFRHIRATAEVGRDGTGQPIEVHVVAQDITDWRRTADELAEVSQRLEEESQLTARLQNIIMPVPDDPLPGVEIAVRYFPAETAPLGGDWYQAIPVDSHDVLLAVGDVAGHGLAAASAMAKLRHAITGLAFADHDPAQILVALNRLLRRMRPDVLATAVVANYDSVNGTLSWSHAGHPPMLLVRGDTVHRLHHPGVLLGVFETVSYTCASARLQAGDLLLMFTDGLIERPGRDLFDGLDALGATISDVLRRRPRDRMAAIMEALAPSNTSDDTCILVARIQPRTGEVS
ncbi:SpoIIE family protein phosphatase [Microbispora sp. RL4-1S]|uniref:SpoIIE family protein phosphatase n=1 Tax=Microbispora oryzae TaxID=2806554 RepID=A0A941ARL1_9ACTN|nr:PP2C family protein-serine/threonine phosphatase [Microbispora oryzae]MBP2706274.1 SpoIIE family protein phosphatase [Microbispora oryzae]